MRGLDVPIDRHAYLRGQPPATGRAASPPAQPPYASSHRRVYVPTSKNGGPPATGMRGLDVLIDRRTYAGGGWQDYPGATDRQLPSPNEGMFGGQRFVTSGGIAAPNSPTEPSRYILYTFTNPGGNTSSILYDSYTGGARQYNYLISADQTYYGPRTPGAPRPEPQPGSVTFGNGLGAFSGAGAVVSAGSQGPFGTGGGPSPGFTPVNPTSPSITTGTYGVPASSPSSPSLTSP